MDKLEEWRDVVGYEGLYQVSDQGNVRRIGAYDHTGWTLPRPVKPVKARDGYAYLNLCRDGKPKTYKVHRLVMEAFIGPCLRGYEVNHKNLVKLDNRLENLEYATGLQNTRHALAAGAMSASMKLTDVQVSLIRQLYAGGATQTGLGRQFGVTQSHIWRIVNHKTRNIGVGEVYYA